MKLINVLFFILALLAGYLIGNYWPLFAPTKTETTVTTPSTKKTTTTKKLPTKDKYPKTSSDRIVLTSVTPDLLVKSPLLLSGAAQVFENQFSARLKDANGKVIAETPVYADSPDAGEFGAFNEFLAFEQPATSTGTLELFEADAASGKEVGIVSVSVKFK